MSENHTDLIVSAKEACQRPVKEERTLLLKRVARSFIVKDVMLENQDDLTCYNQLRRREQRDS